MIGFSHDTVKALLHGIELFNRREYWESHEAWEGAWALETGEVRRMLQGLIQVAAGFHKATKQNQPDTCVTLLSMGLEKLKGLPDDAACLELEALRKAVAVSLEEARRWHRGERKELDERFLPLISFMPPASERS